MALILSGDTGPSFVQSAAMPAGSVIQTVQSTISQEAATSSTSYSATGITASITPSSASSKILVTISCIVGKNGNSGGNLQLWKNGSSISQLATNICYDSTSNNTNTAGYTVSYLDSPATTSSTTYALYLAATSSGQTAKISPNNGFASITLQEIKQ